MEVQVGAGGGGVWALLLRADERVGKPGESPSPLWHRAWKSPFLLTSLISHLLFLFAGPLRSGSAGVQTGD